MRIRTLSLTLAVLLLAAPAFAQGLTDLLQAHRMTVLEVKQNARQIYCLEADGRLRIVEFPDGATPLIVTDTERRADLSLLRAGDVIKVERNGRAPTITILRRAADDIASPEL